jgi:hypothetical protein
MILEEESEDEPAPTGMDEGSFILSSEPEAGQAETQAVAPGYVASLSPPYPKHRDVLILVVAALLLALILIGGYLALRGVGAGIEDKVRRRWDP